MYIRGICILIYDVLYVIYVYFVSKKLHVC
jgi:hypothetical protein